MSAEKGNGTIHQFKSFFDERVEMAQETLSLETMANIAFNFKEVVGSISFPSSFWISIIALIEQLSDISLETVNLSERKLTAGALISLFGVVTTEETIKPHDELFAKTEKTRKELNFGLGSLNIVFTTVMHKIEQLIQEHHQDQLDEMPNEKSDSVVEKYVSQTLDTSIGEEAKKSFKKSRAAFFKIRDNRKEKRELITESLSSWMRFAGNMSRIIFEGNSAMKEGLQVV